MVNESYDTMDTAVFSFWYLMPYTIQMKSGVSFILIAELIASGDSGGLKTVGIQKGEQEIGYWCIKNIGTSADNQFCKVINPLPRDLSKDFKCSGEWSHQALGDLCWLYLVHSLRNERWHQSLGWCWCCWIHDSPVWVTACPACYCSWDNYPCRNVQRGQCWIRIKNNIFT